MIYCPSCGTEINKNENYCSNCGNKGERINTKKKNNENTTNNKQKNNNKMNSILKKSVIIGIIALLLFFVIRTFLLPSTSEPSEADGWTYDEGSEGYRREMTYSENDDLTQEFLAAYEGAWASTENPEVAIIIENEEIQIGLHTDYETFPVTSFELQSREWAYESENYEPGSMLYYLIIEPPAFFSPEITEMSMDYLTLDDEELDKSDYGLFLQLAQEMILVQFIVWKSQLKNISQLLILSRKILLKRTKLKKRFLNPMMNQIFQVLVCHMFLLKAVSMN